METNQLQTKVLLDSNIRVKVIKDNIASLKSEFEPTTLELEKFKQITQNKDDIIVSLSDKHQSVDKLTSVVEKWVLEIQ